MVFLSYAHADRDRVQPLVQFLSRRFNVFWDRGLLADQERAARARILEGRKKLLPLERSLTTAMAKLSRIEASLGYVPAAGRRRAKK